MRKFSVGFFGLLLSASSAVADPANLSVAAESRTMIWNAVVVDHGHIFVSGPRWAGAHAPALARLDAVGTPKPYPDEKWNSWHQGADASRTFVDVNALHRDATGALWVVDTGAPAFGGDPVPGGAKAVRIDLTTGHVTRIYYFPSDVAKKGSYVDDVRFHGRHAYFTDAGRPGIIVLDLDTGRSRRVLDDRPSVTAPTDRSIILDGKAIKAPDGSLLKVNSDPLDVSPDGKWFYFAPLEGPWSRLETRYLDDPKLSPDAVARKVEAWANLPPVGGALMDGRGNLYFSDLAENAIKRRAPDGTITLLVQDSRLHWVDAPFVDEQNNLWLPVPQIDRVALFQGGRSTVEWPIRLFKLHLPGQ